jgi:pimeloyl-ACP methyl ester carboxylesterase
VNQQVVNSSLDLVLLPGLGADCRQWEPQRQALPGLIVPSWIPPSREDTLPTYAARLAEALPREKPLILGGSSFGGMLACEMAHLVRPKAVILIGSCRSMKSLNHGVLLLRPILRWIPSWGIRICKPLAPFAVQTFRHLNPEFRCLCATMFEDADPEFVRWAIRAILAWEPTPPTDIPVYHIHGKRDRMIRASKVKADVLVPEGGHLLNLSHALQVNDFIQKVVTSLEQLPQHT